MVKLDNSELLRVLKILQSFSQKILSVKLIGSYDFIMHQNILTL